MRTQPCDAGDPRRRIALLPWIACPAGVKKIECGIGASSHSFEKWSSSKRKGLNEPAGVAYPFIPVDTGHEYRVSPSTDTVMRWVALFTVTRTLAVAVPQRAAVAAKTRAIRRKGRNGIPMPSIGGNLLPTLSEKVLFQQPSRSEVRPHLLCLSQSALSWRAGRHCTSQNTSFRSGEEQSGSAVIWAYPASELAKVRVMAKVEAPRPSQEDADECLHCEIIDMVDERIAAGGADAADLAALIVESLVDRILRVPEEERASSWRTR